MPEIHSIISMPCKAQLTLLFEHEFKKLDSKDTGIISRRKLRTAFDRVCGKIMVEKLTDDQSNQVIDECNLFLTKNFLGNSACHRSRPHKGVRIKTILDGIGLFYELLMCKQEKVKVATDIKSFMTNSGLNPPALSASRSRAPMNSKIVKSKNSFTALERGSDDCESPLSAKSRNPGFIPNMGSMIKDYDAMKMNSQNLWRNFSPPPELENQTNNSSH